jgi:hypothetical protein
MPPFLTRSGSNFRLVGSGRPTFTHDGERTLSGWMAENAFVTWSTTDEPWSEEQRLIEMLDLPLNLDQNRGHPYHATLSALRASAKERARSLPGLAR